MRVLLACCFAVGSAKLQTTEAGLYEAVSECNTASVERILALSSGKQQLEKRGVSGPKHTHATTFTASELTALRRRV